MQCYAPNNFVMSNAMCLPHTQMQMQGLAQSIEMQFYASNNRGEAQCVHVHMNLRLVHMNTLCFSSNLLPIDFAHCSVITLHLSSTGPRGGGGEGLLANDERNCPLCLVSLLSERPLVRSSPPLMTSEITLQKSLVIIPLIIFIESLFEKSDL